MSGPVERKVNAASIGAAASGLVLWVLDEYVFVGDTVPAPVELAVSVLVAAAAAWVGGYLARHTPRNDPDAVGRHARPGDEQAPQG